MCYLDSVKILLQGSWLENNVLIYMLLVYKSIVAETMLSLH